MGQHAHFLCARDHVQPPLLPPQIFTLHGLFHYHYIHVLQKAQVANIFTAVSGDTISNC